MTTARRTMPTLLAVAGLLLVPACSSGTDTAEPRPVAQSSTADRANDTTIVKWGQPLTFMMDEYGSAGQGTQGKVVVARTGSTLTYTITNTGNGAPLNHNNLGFYGKADDGQLMESETTGEGYVPTPIGQGEHVTRELRFSDHVASVAVADAAMSRIGQWED